MPRCAKCLIKATQCNSIRSRFHFWTMAEINAVVMLLQRVLCVDALSFCYHSVRFWVVFFLYHSVRKVVPQNEYPFANNYIKVRLLSTDCGTWVEIRTVGWRAESSHLLHRYFLSFRERQHFSFWLFSGEALLQRTCHTLMFVSKTKRNTTVSIVHNRQVIVG